MASVRLDHVEVPGRVVDEEPPYDLLDPLGGLTTLGQLGAAPAQPRTSDVPQTWTTRERGEVALAGQVPAEEQLPLVPGLDHLHEQVDGVLSDERRPVPPDLAALCDAAGADLERPVRARSGSVQELTSHVAGAARSVGGSLIFLDLTGAALGYDDGLPSGAPSAAQAWRLGIDPAALGPLVDDYAVLAYAREPERAACDVRSYTDALGGRSPLRAVLRPGVPDADGVANLVAKLAACADAGATAVDFYNYGMAPAPVLTRITEALAQCGW